MVLEGTLVIPSCLKMRFRSVKSRKGVTVRIRLLSLLVAEVLGGKSVCGNGRDKSRVLFGVFASGWF